VLSALIAFLALTASFIKVPETNNQELRWRAQLRARRNGKKRISQEKSLLAILPRPLYIFATLVFIDFIGAFGFAFVEPQMIFYFYDTLLWTSLQFGIVVGVYGVMMVLGEMLLGHLSDNLGRKPIILLGLFLSLFFYIGLATLTDYDLMILVAAISGFGNAILAPAISAFYLDITPDEHHSKIFGIKEASLAFGGVLGPLAVAVVAQFTTPKGIFWIASVLGLFSLIFALLLREPKHKQLDDIGIQEEISIQRTLVAQASLSGIVMQAYAARKPGIH
jgi:MFS family permease